jgi:hypothetical protein
VEDCNGRGGVGGGGQGRVSGFGVVPLSVILEARGFQGFSHTLADGFPLLKRGRAPVGDFAADARVAGATVRACSLLSRFRQWGHRTTTAA